jgi:hypothetical protein
MRGRKLLRIKEQVGGRALWLHREVSADLQGDAVASDRARGRRDKSYPGGSRSPRYGLLYQTPGYRGC